MTNWRKGESVAWVTAGGLNVGRITDFVEPNGVTRTVRMAVVRKVNSRGEVDGLPYFVPLDRLENPSR